MVIWERSSTTISAPLSRSSCLLSSLATPRTNPKLPALPACTPETASSTTTERSGAALIISAAVVKISGLGLPLSLSSADTTPSTWALKYSFKPFTLALAKTKSQFLLEVAIPMGMPFSLSCSIRLIVPSKTSALSFLTISWNKACLQLPKPTTVSSVPGISSSFMLGSDFQSKVAFTLLIRISCWGV